MILPNSILIPLLIILIVTAFSTCLILVGMLMIERDALREQLANSHGRDPESGKLLKLGEHYKR